MKIFLPLLAAMLCLAASTASAQVDVIFSTSADSAIAGTSLDVVNGESGTLFVFIENNDTSGGAVDAVGLDISDAGTSALSATSFLIFEPGGEGTRWNLGIEQGDFDSDGFLVDDSQAGTFLITPDNGIQNGVGPVLFATLNFDAAGLGSNALGFAEGEAPGLISVNGAAPSSVNFGSATVNVVAAVPEPSSMAVIGSLFGASLLRRRRRS